MSPPIEEILHAHTVLQEWVTKNGGRLDQRVQFAWDASRGAYMQIKPESGRRSINNDGNNSTVTPPVTRSTVVIKTPVSLTMSYYDAVDYRPPKGSVTASGDAINDQLLASTYNNNNIDKRPFSSRGIRLPLKFCEAVGPEETTAFFLMGQSLRGSDGFWYPYLRTLPRPEDLTTPLYFGEEDEPFLVGTSLAAARLRRKQIWRHNYENGVKVLRDCRFEGVERYTWDLYLWASTIIASRAFSAKVLAGILPTSEISDEKISVLLPLIDATNHRPLAKVEWQAGIENIGFAVMEDLSLGQEVENNYGPRNNEQLMMNYGFCIANNLCDYREVGLAVPPDTPLSAAKTIQQQKFSDTAAHRRRVPSQENQNKYYVFGISYPLTDSGTTIEHAIFSPDLFGAISVLAANDRELEDLEITAESIRVRHEGYGNSRIVYATLSQIMFECIRHVQTLAVTGERLPQPQNDKQRYATIYRESQVKLSKMGLAVANWVMWKAIDRGPIERTSLGISTSISTNPSNRLMEETEYVSYIRETSNNFTEEELSKLLQLTTSRTSLLSSSDSMSSSPGRELHTLSSAMSLLQYLQLESDLFANIERWVQNLLNEIFPNSNSADAPAGQDQEREKLYIGFTFYLCVVMSLTRTNQVLDAANRLVKWASFLIQHYQLPPGEADQKEEEEDVSWALPDEEDEKLLTIVEDIVLGTVCDARERSMVGNEISSLLSKMNPNLSIEKVFSGNMLRWAWLVVSSELVHIPDNPFGEILDRNSLVADATRTPVNGRVGKIFLYIPS